MFSLIWLSFICLHVLFLAQCVAMLVKTQYISRSAMTENMTEYPKKNNISQNTIFHTLCELTFVKYFAAIITITQDIIQYFRVYFIALKEFWAINDLRPTLYEYKLHSMTKVKELTSNLKGILQHYVQTEKSKTINYIVGTKRQLKLYIFVGELFPPLALF